jgi:hypothetical protein
MHKRSLPDVVWCGIDVSATELTVAVVADTFLPQRTFDNRASGHRALIAWLQRQARSAQVCLCLASHNRISPPTSNSSPVIQPESVPARPYESRSRSRGRLIRRHGDIALEANRLM